MIKTFPPDFEFGVASSAYQIEGAWNEDGRGETIWDRYLHMHPGRETGDIASDHYHHLEEDAELLHELGVDVYRFSISWARIYPKGSGTVNQAGVDFYVKLVSLLKRYGIKPAATLYHWDLPQALQERGGWLNRETVDAFAVYAQTMFDALGDDVDVWLTHNEPYMAAFGGYAGDVYAPGLDDYSSALLAAHNLLLSHGMAVRAYRASGLTGRISIALSYFPSYPATDSAEDQAAALRDRQSHIGWFADPILLGEYPKELWQWYENKGMIMPKILPGDMELIGEKIDFLGVNYYRSAYIVNDSAKFPLNTAYAKSEMDKSNPRYCIRPEYLYEYLLYLDNRYNGMDIVITENGMSQNETLDRNGEVDDPYRIDFIYRHLEECLHAIEQGVHLKGYYHWCFIDDFQWGRNYIYRMGLIYVDYITKKRTIKKSGHWFKKLTSERCLTQTEL